MTTSVTSNEARSHLGRLLRLASEEDEEVIIKVRGEPTAVLISYAEYEQLAELKKMQKRLQALETLRALRRRVSSRTPQLSENEAYKLAGFSAGATQEIIQNDQQIASSM